MHTIAGYSTQFLHIGAPLSHSMAHMVTIKPRNHHLHEFSDQRNARTVLSEIPRRNAVDMNGNGFVKSDYWHIGLPSVAVSRNHNHEPGIRFFPLDGTRCGVAMTECEYGQGMAFRHDSVLTKLPKRMHHLGPCTLSISWPGYQKFKHKISFTRPDSRPATIGDMASLVAGIWRRYYESNMNNYVGPGVQLGPKNVTFNHLRLLALYSHNGFQWQAEVSYVLSN